MLDITGPIEPWKFSNIGPGQCSEGRLLGSSCFRFWCWLEASWQCQIWACRKTVCGFHFRKCLLALSLILARRKNTRISQMRSASNETVALVRFLAHEINIAKLCIRRNHNVSEATKALKANRSPMQWSDGLGIGVGILRRYKASVFITPATMKSRKSNSRHQYKPRSFSLGDWKLITFPANVLMQSWVVLKTKDFCYKTWHLRAQHLVRTLFIYLYSIPDGRQASM